MHIQIAFSIAFISIDRKTQNESNHYIHSHKRIPSPISTAVFLIFFFFLFLFLFFFSSVCNNQAVKEFIEIVNKKIERKTISPSTALKFVLARKLDVQRAVALFEQHELIRKEEDLDNIDPMSDPLRAELETGKFTILVSTFFLHLLLLWINMLKVFFLCLSTINVIAGTWCKWCSYSIIHSSST